VDAGELPEPSHIVVALGSGGTAAGLLAGIWLSGLRSRLLCVVVSDALRLEARRIARLARRTLRLLAEHGADSGTATTTAGMLKLERRWIGGGYGHATPQAERAIELFAEREDVTLDPVYTAKTVAALLDLNAQGALGEGPVLYWHTYSSPPNPVAPGRIAEEATGIC
jgi:D-cysteine desulfhydrase